MQGKVAQSGTLAVTVEKLTKRYGELVAVDGVTFSVQRGEIFGLLGPNGAGKTTTLEILEGLRPADGGKAEVAGIDVLRHARQVKARIGVQLQEAGFFNLLTVRETVGLFASFHVRPRPVDSVLEEMNLQDKARTLVKNLSGGQRQRLSIACALVGEPEVVFLDEPTTGLDPQARRALWETIRRIREGGRTVLLTTHYMEEAETLCDRVAIMDRGRVLDLGTPDQLIARHAPGDRVYVALSPPAASGFVESLPAVRRVEPSDDGAVVLVTDDAAPLLQELVSAASARGLRVGRLRVQQPTLEDVFLTLTGRRLRD